MHFITILSLLIGAAIQTSAVNPFLKHVAKYGMPSSQNEPAPNHEDLSQKASNRSSFLNAKTKPFSVDGSALPFLPSVGESYSGLLPVDKHGRELFFWFFPTSTGAGSKDITVWLNGGPGCSSLGGLLQENGPVLWAPGTYGPSKNNYAFNRLTNIVYVEQPVGVDYSQGNPSAFDEIDVSDQFNAFWKNFVELFDLQHFPIYLTGESYAGQYVPYIGDGMLNRSESLKDRVYAESRNDQMNRRYNQLQPQRVHRAYNYGQPTVVPFVLSNAGSFPFTPSFLQTLSQLQDSCGYTAFLAAGLSFPPKSHLPPLPSGNNAKCDLYSKVYNEITALNPCFNVYEAASICATPGSILGTVNDAPQPVIAPFADPYFNRADVKAALHAPANATWTQCVSDVLNFDSSPKSASANGPIKRIAEKIRNVVVAHATQDFLLIANQTLLALNDLEWGGKQGFDAAPNTPLIVPRGFGKSVGYKELGGWTRSRGITFVTVNLSGHMIPQYQPGAAYRALEYLLGRVSSLDAKMPFTA